MSVRDNYEMEQPQRMSGSLRFGVAGAHPCGHLPGTDTRPAPTTPHETQRTAIQVRSPKTK